MAIALLKQNSLVRNNQVSRKQPRIVCKSSFNLNEIIDKKRDMDKARIERLKEMGTTIDHLAKAEVQQTSQMLKEVFPFLSELKDIQTWDREDIDKWLKSVKTFLQNEYGCQDDKVDKKETKKTKDGDSSDDE
jgi:hypothetical protein